MGVAAVEARGNLVEVLSDTLHLRDLCEALDSVRLNGRGRLEVAGSVDHAGVGVPVLPLRACAVVGSGGGGLLAALVAVSNQPSPPLDATAGSAMPLPRIAAACTLAAPTNLTTLGPEHDRTGSPASRLVGGPLPEFREAAQRASPVAHVSSDDPPLLILHGATDSSVPLQQAKDFDAALRAAAVDSTLVILPGVGRKPSIGRSTPSGLALLSFLDRVLGPGIRPEHAPLP